MESEIVGTIQEAFDEDRVEVTQHFWDELRADGFFLADVRSALDAIAVMRDAGHDRAGNPKFEVTGPACDGRALSVVCSIRETGSVLLITAYEAKKP